MLVLKIAIGKKYLIQFLYFYSNIDLYLTRGCKAHMEQIDRNKIQIIRMGEVSKLSGLSRSTLYEKLNEKSSRYDNSFPKQLKLSRNAVGWLEHEVLEWLDSKAKERFS
mgnify:FL=1